MDPTLLSSLLILTAFLTSILSAVFGMAGGLVLMGVYGSTLPVPAAMILHGTTQMFANGFRFVLLRSHALWPQFVAYLVGTAVAVGLFTVIELTPSKSTLFIVMGLLPLIRFVPVPAAIMDFGRGRGATICGLSVAAVQLLAGVAGPLLDLFFVRTNLKKHAVICNKALTQTLSHFAKTAYFMAITGITGMNDVLTLPTVIGSIVAALVGTVVGAKLMQRLSEQRFRSITGHLVLGIGAIYLCKGIWLLISAY